MVRAMAESLKGCGYENVSGVRRVKMQWQGKSEECLFLRLRFK